MLYRKGQNWISQFWGWGSSGFLKRMLGTWKGSLEWEWKELRKKVVTEIFVVVVHSDFCFYFFILPPQLTFNIIQTFKHVINTSPKSSESFFIWLAGWFAKCMAHVMFLWAAVSLLAGWDTLAGHKDVLGLCAICILDHVNLERDHESTQCCELVEGPSWI